MSIDQKWFRTVKSNGKSANIRELKTHRESQIKPLFTQIIKIKFKTK